MRVWAMSPELIILEMPKSASLTTWLVAKRTGGRQEVRYARQMKKKKKRKKREKVKDMASRMGL